MRVRDKERTRQAILRGAAAAIAEHGANVSLNSVAKYADVSKGALMHHFNSRDALILAVSEYLIAEFRAAVHQHIDPTDYEPGRTLRGYIRASFAMLNSQENYYENVMTALSRLPGFASPMQEDYRRWDTELASDGLDPARALLILRATDGVTLSAMVSAYSSSELTDIRDELLALTRTSGPLR